MQIYKNTYKEYSVWDIYNDFRDMYHAYPKTFTDVYAVEDIHMKQISLSFMPLEVITKPIVTVYPDDANYQAKTNWVSLVEWTHYHIDYDMGLLFLTWAYTLVVWNVFVVVWQYNILNLRQFVNHLNKGLRVLNKYFPVKIFHKYSTTASGETIVSKIDTTELPFVDVEDMYKNIGDKYPIKFERRWQYLLITENEVDQTIPNTYYWVTSNEVTQPEIELPVFIEGNLSPQQISWMTDWNITKNSSFKFAELWYDALLCFIGLEMYKTRMRYSAEINLFTLRLNERGMFWLMQDLSKELMILTWDSKIGRSYANSSRPENYSLNDNT